MVNQPALRSMSQLDFPAASVQGAGQILGKDAESDLCMHLCQQSHQSTEVVVACVLRGAVCSNCAAEAHRSHCQC